MQEPKKKPKSSGQERISFEIPQEEPAPKPTPKAKSFGGFAENLISDTFHTVKGIAEGILMAWPRTIKEGAKIWKDRAYWGKLAENPHLLTNELKKTGKAVVDAVLEPYREHGADVLYHRPATTLLDLVTILSLGGGTVSRFGKLSKSEKIEKLGKLIQEAPSRVAGKLAEGTAMKFGVDLKKRRKTLDIISQEKARASLKAAEDMENVGKKIEGLNDVEAELFRRYRTQGGSAADLAAHPKVAEALERYRALVKEVWQFELKERNLLDDSRIAGALEKKYAAEVYKRIDEQTLAAAREAIKNAEVKPIYGPAIFEKKGGYSVDDILNEAQVAKLGKVSFLEEFKGAEGAITDPRIYIPKAIKGFRDVEGKLRSVERVLQDPDLVRAAARGEAKLSEVIPSQGIFKKYFEDNARAQAVAFREIAKERGGFDEAMKAIAGDEATLGRMKAASTIVADPTVKRILQGEFYKAQGPLGAFLRVYDRILGLFKTSATVLNPKWYTGNIVGDAVLQGMAGVTIGDMRLAKKFLDQMPVNIRAKGAMSVEATGGITEKLNTLGEFTAAIDNAARAGILTKHVRDKLLAAGTNFYELENALKEVLAAPLNLAESEVRLQLALEQAMRKVPQFEKIEAKVAEELGSVAKLREELDSLTRPGVASAREIQIGGRLQELNERHKALTSTQEGLGGSRAVAVGEIKALTRAGTPGIAKKLEKAMRQEAQASVAFYRDALKEVRARGGIAPAAGVEAETLRNVPRSLVGKNGVKADELAQELYDRGFIRDSSVDALHDFIAEAVEAIRKPSIDKAQIKREARNIVATKSEAGIREIIGTTRERAKLKLELSKIKREYISKVKESAEIQQARRLKVESLGKDIEAAESRAAKMQSTLEAMAADRMDDMIRAGKLDAVIPGLREKSAIAMKGVHHANAFLGDYLGLGPIEQSIFRRIVPFYVWGKAMTMLAFRLPFIAPGITFAWHKYAAAMASMHNDEELPEWMSGYVPMFSKADGSQVWAKVTSLSPFGGLRTSKFAEIPIPAVADVISQNPFLSVIYRMKGGRDIFDKGSIPYGEPMVNMGNGDVYEFTEDGKLRKTIPQVPLIKGITHMFPVVQMLEQLASPYDVSAGPVMNPDGSYKYPREFGERLASMFGPKIITGDRQRFINSEKYKVRKAIMELRGSYLRADPERQQFIREAMRDYAAGQYRRFKFD